MKETEALPPRLAKMLREQIAWEDRLQGLSGEGEALKETRGVIARIQALSPEEQVRAEEKLKRDAPWSAFALVRMWLLWWPTFLVFLVSKALRSLYRALTRNAG
jgi:hypothetical protein